jgi:hypothetical protein
MASKTVTVKVDFDLTIELDATYAPGRPETPPAYDHGGLPAEGPEIEAVGINKVLVEGLVLDLKPDVRDRILSAIKQHDALLVLIDEAICEEAAD